jgi:hypothetical protein
MPTDDLGAQVRALTDIVLADVNMARFPSRGGWPAGPWGTEMKAWQEAHPIRAPPWRRSRTLWLCIGPA